MIKLKNIAALLLLGVFLLNVLVAGVVFFNFKINQSYIAANSCVEKDLEVNTCQGSCHLKEEIKKVTTPTQQDEGITVPNNHFTSLICEVNTIHIPFFKSLNQEKRGRLPFPKLTEGYQNPLLQPPISL